MLLPSKAEVARHLEFYRAWERRLLTTPTGLRARKHFEDAAYLLDTRSFPTTREGYRQLLSWARAFGRLQQAGVECTGSYGAALTRYLHQEGITVTEVNQPDKGVRRRQGKSDSIDAAAVIMGVVDGVDTGGDVVLESAGDLVEVLEDLVRGQVEVGEGAGWAPTLNDQSPINQQNLRTRTTISQRRISGSGH
ncbi:transposase [Streptomyces sp. NBC_01003]|uniref:IS110 family transposase n=1 Tax=Streptomyces sp. NBC_01003 TaxID=2903714 RepID=UPI00386C82EE